MYSFIMRMLLIFRESTTLTKKLPKLFILSSYQKNQGIENVIVLDAWENASENDAFFPSFIAL